MRRHGLAEPSLLAAGGFGLILWALVGTYIAAVEMAGFAAIIAAAAWDWQFRRNHARLEGSQEQGWIVSASPLLKVPTDLVRNMLSEPGEDAQSCVPAPFSKAADELITCRLRPAGRKEIRFTRTDAPGAIDTVDAAIAFQSALASPGDTHRETDDEAEARHERIFKRLYEALASDQTENGVGMAQSSWRIDARNSAPALRQAIRKEVQDDLQA